MKKELALYKRATILLAELEAFAPTLKAYAKRLNAYFDSRKASMFDEYTQEPEPDFEDLEAMVLMLLREHDPYTPLAKIVRNTQNLFREDFRVWESTKPRFSYKVDACIHVLKILIEHLSYFVEPHHLENILEKELE